MSDIDHSFQPPSELKGAPDIRHAQVEDIPSIIRVQIDSWRTTYSGILPASYLASIDVQQRTDRLLEQFHRPGVLHFVAESQLFGIVGYVAGGPIRQKILSFDGELYAIYLLKEHQGKGLGAKLTVTLSEHLRAAGMISMVVWVLAKNPSRRFYERLGGQLTDTRFEKIGGITLQEIAYGWMDLGRVGIR